MIIKTHPRYCNCGKLMYHNMIIAYKKPTISYYKCAKCSKVRFS